MRKLLVLLPLLCISLAYAAAAQSLVPAPGKVVQLSGIVLAADSLSALEGVAVYVPGTTRSAYSRKSGYFSLPVLAGDTVVFAALGHHKLYLTVPAGTKEASMTIRITLERKENTLPTVEVMPWATEQDFKQAVLRTRLPDEEQESRPHIPPPVAYKSITDMPAMDADANFRYGQKLLQQGRESRFRVPDILKITSIPIR